MQQMPLIIALGINFGIVPLLFAHGRLRAGLFSGHDSHGLALAHGHRPAAAGLLWRFISTASPVCPRRPDGPAFRASPVGRRRSFFPAIGFLFANAMSLMQNVAGWEKLYLAHNHYGAVLGTALNTADSRLWPRWLMMFGIALTTTAAWVVFDAGWFAPRRERPLSQLGAPLRVETLSARHGLVSSDGQLVCLRHVAATYQRRYVPSALAAADGGDRSFAGRGMAMATARRQGSGPISRSAATVAGSLQFGLVFRERRQPSGRAAVGNRTGLQYLRSEN